MYAHQHIDYVRSSIITIGGVTNTVASFMKAGVLKSNPMATQEFTFSDLDVNLEVHQEIQKSYTVSAKGITKDFREPYITITIKPAMAGTLLAGNGFGYHLNSKHSGVVEGFIRAKSQLITFIPEDSKQQAQSIFIHAGDQ
jgi:hypothetical protein